MSGRSALSERGEYTGRDPISSQGIGPSLTSPPKRSTSRPKPAVNKVDFLQHRFNSGHVILSNGESKKLLGDNSGRRYLEFQNNGSGQIRISYGRTASSTFGTIMYPGDTLTFNGGIVPNNEVYVYATTNTEIDFVEGSVA